MKTLARFTVIVLLIALVLPIASVGAQGGGDDEALAPDVAAVFYQAATAGSFEAMDDGSYTLTLEGVGENIIWLVSYPGMQVYTMPAMLFNDDWGANPELMANAVLEVDDLNIELILSAPTYADGVQTYVAIVENIIEPVETKDGPELPMMFADANLAIEWSLDFHNGLVAGIDARYEGARATPEECTAAKTAVNEWLVWDQQKAVEQNNARAVCSSGDAAACDLQTSIAIERYLTRQGMIPVIKVAYNECA
ncbi:MAG: hypothetical protein JXQ72_14135 [Anaerolineae bacterium]|nr:hypothetical protein [Anaerolineae bacterium]